MKVRIVPYKRGSASAKLLAKTLSDKIGSPVLAGLPSRYHTNILWGYRSGVSTNLQPSYNIGTATNKLATFNRLKEAEVSIPDFTTNKTEAEKWIEEGITVFARQQINSSGGKGIVVCTELPLPPAPLYVKYIKKLQEFRVHVFNGAVIDVQEKRRKSLATIEANEFIRNHDNGWVFCRENIREPETLRETSIKAVQALGLLFGAVDIIYNRYHNKVYVLEVNTAPGLTDTTAHKYAESILKLQ